MAAGEPNPLPVELQKSYTAGPSVGILDDARDSRKRDPEILQVERIARMLEELDELARRRIVIYLTDRYAPHTHEPF